MSNILTIASGKGGVGKSSLSVNLSIMLAHLGHSVVLCDFDFGGANLHTLLGLKNNHAGIGNFIYRQNKSLTELLQETSEPNLHFIAGDCLFPGTANMDFFIKKKIVKELESLESEFIVIDLGGGSSYNILDFFLMTYNSILVTTPELTSIMNAYSFLKSAAFRFLTQQFPARSEERKFISSFLTSETSGTEASFISLLDQLSAQFPESGQKARAELDHFHPQIILNQVNLKSDLEMARRLRSLVEKKLGIKVTFIGVIPSDPSVPMAVARRTPACVLAPDSTFASNVTQCAQRILNYEYFFNEQLSGGMVDELLQYSSEYQCGNDNQETGNQDIVNRGGQ